MALIPLGTAFTFPRVTALLSRVIASTDRSLYVGLQQTFGGVARAAAPLFRGWAFDHLGIGMPFLVLGRVRARHAVVRYRPRAPRATEGNLRSEP